jgi:hypothetical protein
MFDRDCKEWDVTWIVCAFFADTQLGIDLFQSWISLDARLIDQAGLPHRTAHGLRAAGATIAANNSATAHRAILGWGLLKQVEIYTREADQKRLAEAAMHLLDEVGNETGSKQVVCGGDLRRKSPVQLSALPSSAI